jgi:signal transduction histidine kinase
MSTSSRPATRASSATDIVGYRTFVAIVVTAYVTIIALTPRASWEMTPASWAQLVALSALYLALGTWGFEQVQRQRRFVVSVTYLLLEFAVGMRINQLAWGGMVPLILLPLAAQAVSLLPRVWAGLMCVLVIGGVSGNLSWWPEWPEWLRNIASATAAVVFVVVYSGVAVREREARHRAERLAADVAELAAVNERSRMAREIHDTLGHYLTVIHIQLEAARAVVGVDQARGMLAVSRAQALAKDGLTAVRQSVRALRADARVDDIAAQLASIVESVQDETFAAVFTTAGSPRSVSAEVALALQRTTLEALTNVRRHANANRVDIHLDFDRGFGLTGIRERAEQLRGTAIYRTAPGKGFDLAIELPA